MSRFDKILHIKEEFDDNLYKTSEFKHTKGLLYDFGNYMSKNKGIIYALLIATTMNIAAKIIPTEIFENNQIKIENIYENPSSKIDQYDIRLKSDYSEMSTLEQVNKLNNDIVTARKIINANHIGIEIPEMDRNGIKAIELLPDSDSLIFKNPFWNNNIVEIIKQDYSGSFYKRYEESNYSSKLHESLLIVDNEKHKIVIDFQQLETLKRVANITESESDTFDRFVIYHESAHASFEQSFGMNNSDQVGRRGVNKELHSDLAAITMIAIEEGRDINSFNKIMDIAIKIRSVDIQNSAIHSTLYGLLEYKNFINERPYLLNMNKNEISPFTQIITDEISKANFNEENDKELANLGVDFSSEYILSNISNKDNKALYNEWSGDVFANNKFELNTFVAENSSKRIERLSKRLSDDFRSKANFDAIPIMVYLANGKDSTLTIESLTKYIEKNPILSDKLTKGMDYKIKMESLSKLDLREFKNKSNGNLKI